MKVCVVGAGIVGCATAYQLARQGHEVLLVDSDKGPGRGTSFANGAQLSYSYVEPLASPATLLGLPSMLLSPDSPLRFRLRLDARQWWWCLQFLSACNARQTRQGTRELLLLAQLSRATLEQWMAQEAWQFSFQQNGKLVLCPDDDTLRRQAAQVRFQSDLGCQQAVLNPKACVDKEPALSGYQGQFAGGVWTADECVGDPHALSLRMTESLLRMGGQLHFETTVTGFSVRAGRIVAAQAPGGEIPADVFVIANGAAAPGLAASVHVSLPIYPIKGYSITLPIHSPHKAPVVSVTDLGRKTVFAPLGGRLRVAAMAEVVGHDLSIPPSRIQRMVRAVDALFPGACGFEETQPWAGLRPATPTAVPITRQMGPANLYVNAGHGALGFTLAAGSAVVLGRQIMARITGTRDGSGDPS
jgi:D-amino-acid dehydrogenase